MNTHRLAMTASDRCTAVPDLTGCGVPRQPPRHIELFAELRRVAGEIDHPDVPEVVAEQRMLEERQPVACRREPQMTQPSIGFIQGSSDRILDAEAMFSAAHYG